MSGSDSWKDDTGIDGNYGETDESNGTDDVNKTSDTNDSGEIRNIRDSWNGRTCYVPDDLATNIDRAFLSMQSTLLDRDRSIKKNRHFYPIVLKLGIEALEETDADRIESLIEEIHS